mmetsp:Transcript_20449/g.43864  ORF Transcript_20449/g.43864 Transcript_20449/m.43864 type:complete len:149 (+) Transcript_20449:191-637(+)
MLYIDTRVVTWVEKQPSEVKAKYRKAKENALSDAWWHRNQVFVAVTQPIESSLRLLDSGTPNLKDAAFAFEQLIIEFGEPPIGALASIPEWGEIDLRLDLSSEYMGRLDHYVKAMVQKRKADWLSALVLAARLLLLGQCGRALGCGGG